MYWYTIGDLLKKTRINIWGGVGSLAISCESGSCVERVFRVVSVGEDCGPLSFVEGGFLFRFDVVMVLLLWCAV